jgi:hypothetical protein
MGRSPGARKGAEVREIISGETGGREDREARRTSLDVLAGDAYD